MAQQLLSVEQVKVALGIETFRNLSKEKIMEFVSLIPNMDKDVAMSIINQFPAYAEMAGGMIVKLDEMCDTAMVKAGESQKESISAYKMILADLGELLKKDDITPEERTLITDKMILVADKIAAKDSEFKTFLLNVIKTATPYIGGALMLGAVILGVNAKGNKIPSLKN